MRSVAYLAFSSLAAVAAAQGSDNAFSNPPGGYKFEAGKPTTLEWEPSTDGTVTLKLQIRNSITPDSGTIIANGIPNSGSFAYTPSADLGPGSDYTIEIIDDSDPENYNFTPQFSVDGTTGTASGLPTASATDSSSSSASPSATPTESSSSSSETAASTSPTASSTTSGTSTSSSASATESTSTTSSSEPSSTPTDASETDADSDAPDPNGAASLTLPGTLLSVVLALMAFL